MYNNQPTITNTNNSTSRNGRNFNKKAEAKQNNDNSIYVFDKQVKQLEKKNQQNGAFAHLKSISERARKKSNN